MEDERLLEQMDLQRLETLALADQIKDDRWRAPLLPGGRTLHNQVAHILAWDEWAIGIFELSAIGRAIPPKLVEAARDSDAYNARSEARFQKLRRDDVLEGLEAAHTRLIQASVSAGGEDWAARPIPELQALLASLSPLPPPEALPDGYVPMGDTVGGVLRHLVAHEHAHAQEISATFGIEPHLERFQEGENTAPGGAPAGGAQ